MGPFAVVAIIPVLSTSFWDYVAENAIGIAIGGLITGALVGALRFGSNRKSAADERHVNEASEFGELKSMVGEIYGALITPEATPFDPHPAPRLIDTVATMLENQERMEGRLKKVETTLTQNGGTGNTVLDRISRVEGAVGVPPEVTHAPSEFATHAPDPEIDGGDEYAV